MTSAELGICERGGRTMLSKKLSRKLPDQAAMYLDERAHTHHRCAAIPRPQDGGQYICKRRHCILQHCTTAWTWRQNGRRHGVASARNREREADRSGANRSVMVASPGLSNRALGNATKNILYGALSTGTVPIDGQLPTTRLGGQGQGQAMRVKQDKRGVH